MGITEIARAESDQTECYIALEVTIEYLSLILPRQTKDMPSLIHIYILKRRRPIYACLTVKKAIIVSLPIWLYLTGH